MKDLLVAIIGKPNVGKSTLFNALVNKKLAITHKTPGVTHEGTNCLFNYNNHTFLLQDTGGITDEGIFSKEISKRSKDILSRASLIIFVVSVKDDLNAEDYYIIDFLRKQNIVTILVVNKVDTVSLEWEAQNFSSLGFGKTFFVSATHKKNIDGLLNLICEKISMQYDHSNTTPSNTTAVKKENINDSSHIRLLILGKPNTGKSSLINKISNSDLMVSDTPGTTRDICENHFEYNNKPYTLVDSAGIRKKNKILQEIEYYSIHRAITAIENVDIVLLLVSVLNDFSEQDKKLSSLVLRRGKGLVIGLNKWDCLDVTSNRLQAEKDRICFLLPQIHFAPILPLSAKTGYGISKLFKTLQNINTQLYTRINTSKLNNHMKKWILRTPPPIKRGRKGKIKFIAQKGGLPILFVMYVNSPNIFTESYITYIKNQIRKDFLHEIPFDIKVLKNI